MDVHHHVADLVCRHVFGCFFFVDFEYGGYVWCGYGVE